MPQVVKNGDTDRTNGKSKDALPIALARRASAAAAARHERLLRKARELLALIARTKGAMDESFYDIGEALARLKGSDMISVLGRKSFAEVCERDATIAPATAARLVAVVTTMTRDQALAMGAKKATAAMSLSDATPRAASPAKVVKAPKSAKVTKAAKAKTPKAPAPSLTPEEKQLASLLEKRLRQLGLDRARVRVVPSKTGEGADLVFEHVPASKVDLLKKAIGR